MVRVAKLREQKGNANCQRLATRLAADEDVQKTHLHDLALSPQSRDFVLFPALNRRRIGRQSPKVVQRKDADSDDDGHARDVICRENDHLSCCRVSLREKLNQPRTPKSKTVPPLTEKACVPKALDVIIHKWYTQDTSTRNRNRMKCA